MNVLISISHPAWAHQFHHIINILQKRGHKVKVLVIKKDRNWEVLDEYGIGYKVVGKGTGKNKIDKALILLTVTFKHFIEAIKFKADVLIGRPSPMMAITAFLTGKKNIVYSDTETAVESLFFTKLFSYKILTPMMYRKDFGKKQMRVETFKELFYLHPDYFKPDPSDLKIVGLKPGERFSFVRFVALKASHDLDYKGVTNEQRLKIIKHLEKYGKVIISSEADLPKEFDKYKRDIPHTKLHSIMSQAQLFVGDGLTMAFESNVMGVHAITIYEMITGAADELEQKYNLLYIIKGREDIVGRTKKKIDELLRKDDIKEIAKKKQRKLLEDKKNFNEWWVNYLEKEIRNAKE
jgi:uncharacterized protein